MNKRQNMNWPLAANFEATNVTFLPKKLASNVQSTCIDNSKRPKSELWHYCIKATKCSCLAEQFTSKLNAFFFYNRVANNVELPFARFSPRVSYTIHVNFPSKSHTIKIPLILSLNKKWNRLYRFILLRKGYNKKT